MLSDSISRDVIMQKLQCTIASHSEPGLKTENQDSFGFLCPDEEQTLQTKGIVAAIADGVSSSDFGKDASACCIQSIMHDYYCTADSWPVQRSMQKVLVALNSWMFDQSRQTGRFRSMATTLTAAVFKANTAHIFHVGDGRVYLLRHNELQCLTHDHTWPTIQGLQLTRAIGMDLNVDIEYRKWSLHQDDIFIFTTNGVHRYLQDEQISAAFNETDDLNAIAQNLVKLALKQGSPKNLTCQIVKICSLPPKHERNTEQLTHLLAEEPELNHSAEVKVRHTKKASLLERNPVAFWQRVSLFLLLMELITLMQLFK